MKYKYIVTYEECGGCDYTLHSDRRDLIENLREQVIDCGVSPARLRVFEIAKEIPIAKSRYLVFDGKEQKGTPPANPKTSEVRDE